LKGLQATPKDKKGLQFFLIVLAVIFLDQIIKLFFQLFKINFDSQILSFHLVKNSGAAFSLLHNQNTLLAFIGIFVLGFIFFKIDYVLIQKSGLAFAVITGGIIGNLLDRIFFGFVLDFIDFHFWPVFNIADSAISIGIILMIAIELKKSK